jgi:hypothetical protein
MVGIKEVTAKPGKVINLRGTVRRIKNGGFDVTYKINNLAKGLHDLAEDVRVLGPLIYRFNMFDKAPKLSAAVNDKVSLSHHRNKYCDTMLFRSSLHLNKNNSLSIISSQRAPKLKGPIDATEMKIFVSRSRISMKIRNDWDPREWWIPPDRDFALTCRHPLRAIKMSVLSAAVDACKPISFHLLLNSYAWRKKEKETFPITGLWPVEIEGLNANWRFALTNSKHTLCIPGEKKEKV